MLKKTIKMLTKALLSLLFTVCSILHFSNACAAPPPAPSPLPELRVGISADFPPFSFIEKEKYVGFDIDIITVVAKRIQYKITFIDMPFKTLIPAIQTGKIDVIASGLTETRERAKQVLFAPAHFMGDPLVIVTKKDNAVENGLSDLVGKTVIVNDGYTAAQYMENHPGSHLLYLKSPSDAIMALESNRGFAFITAKSTMQNFFEKHPHAGQYKLFSLEGTGDSTGLAVIKENPELHAKIKQAILDMLKDGTVEQLKKKWKLS